MDLPQPEPADRAAPWGPWASITIAVLAFVAAGVLPFLVFFAGTFLVSGDAPDAIDPPVLIPITVAIYILYSVFLALACRFRRGWTALDYLAIRRTGVAWLAGVSVANTALWIIGLVVIIKFMKTHLSSLTMTQETTLNALLMLTTWEIALRGFLYRGLAASRLGPWGAIALTSAVLPVVAAVSGSIPVAVLALAIGLVLGIARYRSRSIVPALVANVVLLVAVYVMTLVGI